MASSKVLNNDFEASKSNQSAGWSRDKTLQDVQNGRHSHPPPDALFCRRGRSQIHDVQNNACQVCERARDGERAVSREPARVPVSTSVPEPAESYERPV